MPNCLSKLHYQIKDEAPSTEQGLFNEASLVIWSGASDTSVFQDERVNWGFRALHDQLHLKSGYSFNPRAEMALGRIQASKYDGILADIVYLEVAGQAEYYMQNSIFVPNQVEWTLSQLRGL